MADRIPINPATEPGGPDVLTDTVTSVNGSAVTAVDVQRTKPGFGGDGTYQDVSAGTPLPVTDAGQATVHTDLQALLTQLVAILAKQPADPSTGAKQDALIAKDYATQTTLAAVLAKITADPATQTTLAAVLTKLTTSAASPLATRLSDGSAYLNLATISDRLKVDVGNLSTSPIPITDVTPAYVGPKAQAGYDVTTSSTTAVAARAGRSLIQVMNTSDTPIWIALDSDTGGTPAAATGSGYWLGPNGGAWSEAYTGAVRAKHDGTGTKRLSYVEW